MTRAHDVYNITTATAERGETEQEIEKGRNLETINNNESRGCTTGPRALRGDVAKRIPGERVKKIITNNLIELVVRIFKRTLYRVHLQFLRQSDERTHTRNYIYICRRM